MNGIKVAIVGIGNCASALVQGVEHYKKAKANTENIGLEAVGIEIEKGSWIKTGDYYQTNLSNILGTYKAI